MCLPQLADAHGVRTSTLHMKAQTNVHKQRAGGNLCLHVYSWAHLYVGSQ